jgi:hypothetical protein
MIPQEIKINFKDLIIIVLIGICIWFYFKPFDKTDIDELDKDNSVKSESIKKIQFERDSLLEERKKLDKKLEKFEELAILRGDTINFYKKLSKLKDFEIKDLKEDLKIYNQMLESRNIEIDQLIRKPIILPKNLLVEKTKEKLK